MPSEESTLVIKPTVGVVAVLIDMQPEFVKNMRDGEREQVITEQCHLIRECVEQDIPLVVLEYGGSGPTIEILAAEISKVKRKVVVTKYDDDGFYTTRLNQVLIEFSAKQLILMGVNASYCVLATAISAVRFGYEIITSRCLIADAKYHSPGKSSEWYLRNGTLLDQRPVFKSS